jgi:hypothetical protein
LQKDTKSRTGFDCICTHLFASFRDSAYFFLLELVKVINGKAKQTSVVTPMVNLRLEVGLEEIECCSQGSTSLSLIHLGPRPHLLLARCLFLKLQSPHWEEWGQIQCFCHSPRKVWSIELVRVLSHFLFIFFFKYIYHFYYYYYFHFRQFSIFKIPSFRFIQIFHGIIIYILTIVSYKIININFTIYLIDAS